jgi:hypothetical protein
MLTRTVAIDYIHALFVSAIAICSNRLASRSFGGDRGGSYEFDYYDRRRVPRNVVTIRLLMLAAPE